jgi:hypothetical protein
MKTHRLLIDEKTNKVVRYWDSETDLNTLVEKFIEQELFGLLLDCEYYENGTYDIDKNYYGTDVTAILFSGDNGYQIYLLKEVPTCENGLTIY